MPRPVGDPLGRPWRRVEGLCKLMHICNRLHKRYAPSCIPGFVPDGACLRASSLSQSAKTGGVPGGGAAPQ